MDAKTLVLYICNNNQVNKMSLSLQLQYVPGACRTYCVDVYQLWSGLTTFHCTSTSKSLPRNRSTSDTHGNGITNLPQQ